MRASIFVAFWLFISLGLFGSEPKAVLPFEIHLGHIYIKARVNDSEELNIAFDTGARGNLLDEQLAERLGLKVSGKQQVSGASGTVAIKVSNGNELILTESLRIRRETFLLMDLDHLGDYHYPLDGVIGGGILDEYIVDINFDTKEIKLYGFEDFKEPNGYMQKRVSLIPFRVPIVPGLLTISNSEGFEGPYLVDTGAALALRLNTPFVNKEDLRDKVTPNYAYSSKALSAASTDYIGKLKGFRVLDEDFESVPIRMATGSGGVSGMDNVDGIMGLEILKRFNLIFDYRKNRMYYRKSSLFSSPFRFNKLGLKLKRLKDFFTVEGITKGSPAEEAGIREGDQILKVDGKSDLTLDELFEYIQEENRLLEIEFKRGEEITVVKATTKTLI